jgi:dimethylargininase
MLTAITRRVSPCLRECELSFVPRQSIDIVKATQQHRIYEQRLTALGVRIMSLAAEPELPDAVFVEDPAVVVDEVAVMTIMGTTKRQSEVESVASALSAFRPLHFLSEPARLEGGDVMRISRTLYVGASNRTNHTGIDQLAAMLSPYGYQVRAVDVRGCLHLKTGCSYLGRDTILANRAWVDVAQIDRVHVLDVPPAEPWAANVLMIGEVVLLPESFPQTRALLANQGFDTQIIDMSELLKAEAGLTCMSIIFEA